MALHTPCRPDCLRHAYSVTQTRAHTSRHPTEGPTHRHISAPICMSLLCFSPQPIQTTAGNPDFPCKENPRTLAGWEPWVFKVPPPSCEAQDFLCQGARREENSGPPLTEKAPSSQERADAPSQDQAGSGELGFSLGCSRLTDPALPPANRRPDACQRSGTTWPRQLFILSSLHGREVLLQAAIRIRKVERSTGRSHLVCSPPAEGMADTREAVITLTTCIISLL